MRRVILAETVNRRYTPSTSRSSNARSVQCHSTTPLLPLATVRELLATFLYEMLMCPSMTYVRRALNHSSERRKRNKRSRQRSIRGAVWRACVRRAVKLDEQFVMTRWNFEPDARRMVVTCRGSLPSPPHFCIHTAARLPYKIGAHLRATLVPFIQERQLHESKQQLCRASARRRNRVAQESNKTAAARVAEALHTGALTFVRVRHQARVRAGAGRGVATATS
jgi:hypothetical protein